VPNQLIRPEIPAAVEWIVGEERKDALLLDLESGLGPEAGEAVASRGAEGHADVEGSRSGEELLEAIIKQLSAHCIISESR
jgi:hypothetical protein